MVYVDESGIDTFLVRTHGWGPRGAQVMGETSGRRFYRASFVAAQVGKRMIAPIGTCTALLFGTWVEAFLVRKLGPVNKNYLSQMMVDGIAMKAA